MPPSVIVVGHGIMGASIAHALAARGAEVTVLEQFEPGTLRGSSHGHSRAFREAYYEHADYVPLLREAGRMWEDLEADSGRQLLVRCGCLYMGEPDWEVVAETARSAALHDIPCEMLDAADVARRFPMFALPEGFVAAYEPGAGFVVASAAFDVFTKHAAGAGATFVSGERVTGIDEAADGAVVTTTHERYEADAVVVAGGAWTASLLPDLARELRVTRHVMAWCDVEDARRADASSIPVWIMQHGDAYPPYGFPLAPEVGGEAALKLAFHGSTDVVGDPDALDQPATSDEIAQLEATLAMVMPALAAPVTATRTCRYTNTRDTHFIIDRAPGRVRTFVAAGWSGHGFKFAPIIGRAVSDLVFDGGTELPIGFLGVDRLQA